MQNSNFALFSSLLSTARDLGMSGGARRRNRIVGCKNILSTLSVSEDNRDLSVSVCIHDRANERFPARWERYSRMTRCALSKFLTLSFSRFHLLESA